MSCSCFWTFAHCALCSVMFSQCLYYTTVVFLIKLQIIIHYTTRSNTVVVSKIYNLSLKKANILVPSLDLMSKKSWCIHLIVRTERQNLDRTPKWSIRTNLEYIVFLGVYNLISMRLIYHFDTHHLTWHCSSICEDLHRAMSKNLFLLL